MCFSRHQILPCFSVLRQEVLQLSLFRQQAPPDPNFQTHIFCIFWRKICKKYALKYAFCVKKSFSLRNATHLECINFKIQNLKICKKKKNRNLGFQSSGSGSGLVVFMFCRDPGQAHIIPFGLILSVHDRIWLDLWVLRVLYVSKYTSLPGYSGKAHV